MANLSRLNGGLKVIGSNRRANIYVAGGTVYPGDPLTPNSSGFLVVASAGVPLIGAALSYASASGIQVLVADHPDQEFSLQCSVSAGIASQTGMNLNYNVLSGSPSSTYRLSGATLDDSSGLASAGGSLQVKALRLEQRDNNAFGLNADIVVIINNHVLKGGTGTVGV